MLTWALALALLAGTGACSAAGRRPAGDRPVSVAASSYRGLPPGLPEPPAVGSPAAVWTDGRLALVLWGSGSCPPVPVALEARGTDTVEITVSSGYGGVCTADYAATTSVLELPGTVATAGPLTVRLRFDRGGRTELTVPRP